MDNAFNSPAEVLEANMKAGEGKVKLPILKCILLGIMAGAFIAFGGASSNAAVHNIANQGLSKTLAGCIFPVGLMMIVFVGGELFTGDCLMIAGVTDKRIIVLAMVKKLIIVFFSNMVGAVLIATLVYYSGLL
ncbi:MAG: formate/nitrite transporter family protein, partial [Lachnospiraceae bacterium]|nr:formate/nitrite transporter family protein [Lachnospiraceae bacterium]